MKLFLILRWSHSHTKGPRMEHTSEKMAINCSLSSWRLVISLGWSVTRFMPNSHRANIFVALGQDSKVTKESSLALSILVLCVVVVYCVSFVVCIYTVLCAVYTGLYILYAYYIVIPMNVWGIQCLYCILYYYIYEVCFVLCCLCAVAARLCIILMVLCICYVVVIVFCIRCGM